MGRLGYLKDVREFRQCVASPQACLEYVAQSWWPGALCARSALLRPRGCTLRAPCSSVGRAVGRPRPWRGREGGPLHVIGDRVSA